MSFALRQHGVDDVLQGRAVHVWWCRVDALERPGMRALCHRLMNDDERARHDRFLVARVRDEFLLARGLCRSALSRYAPVAPEAWVFGSNTFGRPHILRPSLPQPLHFNLTHTEGLAAIAITQRGYEVGIDAENTERTVELLALAQRNFSAREAAYLAGQPDGAARRQAFFAMWTLKEAYIKARGMGMSIPLDQFSVNVATSAPHMTFDADVQDDGAAWQLSLHAPTKRHALALAVRRGAGAQATIVVREA